MHILVFVLFFISGMTGLIYEVAWTRLLITVFGSTAYAVSTVLAAFMGGLALGSIIFGRVGDRLKRPVLAYGVLEALIAIYALAVPLIIGSLVGVYSDIFETFGRETFPVAVVRFLLSFLVILVPTTLMGGTLPILSKYAGREFRRIGRNIGLLYAINTFGAVVGSFATGFLLLEAFGVTSSIYLAAGLGLGVGVIAIIIGRKAQVPEAAPVDRIQTPIERMPAPIPSYTAKLSLVAIAISGGAALAYEVIYTKVLVFSLGATVHAFTVMLTTFLIGIALGSSICSRLVDRLRRPSAAFGLIEILIGITALASLFPLSRLNATHEYLALRDGGGNILKLRGADFLQAGLIMLVPSMLMGAAFPAITRIYTRRDQVASSIGRIYFSNTIGAVIGSLLAGFLLVPVLGSARSIAFVAAFNVAIGVLLYSCTGRRKVWAVSSLVAFLVMLSVTYMIKPSLLSGTFNIRERYSELLYFKEGVSGTVTVHRYPDYDLLAVDGVNVAGTSDMLRVTQKLQGHLPILLADSKDRIVHIGFGSGETLRILTMHKAKTIDGIEICKEVIDVAKRFFAALNQNVFDRPEVNIIIMDGKNFMLLTKDTYDIIMTDSIYPGMSGSSSLYTYDHFKAVSDKLKPGGVASCWLPLDLSRQDLRVALKAFRDVFPNMTVWYCYMTFSQHALLIGKKDRPITIDMAKIEKAFADSAIRADFQSILIDDPYTLISCMIADGESIKRFCDDAPRHSDDHPILEFGLALRGTGKPYLSSNLEQLLALRPNPLKYITAIAEIGIDSVSIIRTITDRYVISSNIIGGHIHNALGEVGLARAQYAKVLEIDPENRIAKSAIEALDRSIAGLETAARLGQSFQTIYKLGLRYLADGKYEAALEKLDQALSLRPDLPDAYVSIGECYLRWGKPEKAIGFLEKATRIRPKDGGILLRLGLAYKAAGTPEKAAKLFEEAVRLNPDNYEGRIHLGVTYLNRGKARQAAEQFEKAIEINPARPHAYYSLGQAYVAQGRLKEALECYKRSIEAAPTFYPAYFQLGNVLYELGDLKAAENAWRKTLILKSDHKGARKHLENLRNSG